MNTNSFERHIADTVHASDKNAKVWLYGSRARGDFREDSDWDLLILLDKDKLTPTDRDKIEAPLYDLGFKADQLICPLLYTVKDWEWRSFTPFYKNVVNDRRELI